MAKKQQVTPQLDLKRDDFMHAVPEDQKMEIIIHWKGGNKYKPDFINPVAAFAKHDGQLKVINRNLPDYVYAYDLKEIKAVYILPMGE
jgi:hypothetical protein